MTARLRTVRLLALVTATVLGLVGCGSDPEASGMPAERLRLPGPDPALLAAFPEGVRTSGTLVLATDPHYPPSAFTDLDGEIVGVGADFAAAIRAKTGLRTEWVEVPFDGMLAGLQAGRFDVSWSGWTVTPERTQVLDLVTYLSAGTTVLVRSGNPEAITHDVDLCGRTVSAQLGTTQAQEVIDELQERCAAAGRPPVVRMTMPQQTTTLQALATGRADAALADNTAVGYQAKQQPGLFGEAPGVRLRPSLAGIAVAKSDPALAAALSVTFNALIADGTYGRILSRWGISGAALERSEVNPGSGA